MTFFRCLCLLFILCCCNSKPKTDAGMIRVSVLRGPSAIAFAHWMEETPVVDDKPLSVRIIDSPDLMQAALIKGEADIAVRLEHTADDCRAERGMVHVGISDDIDKVKLFCR